MRFPNPSLVAAAALAVATAACNSSPPGGATGTAATFTVVAPTGVTIKQGDRETSKLTLNRGAEFRQAVKLEASGPKGLIVEVRPTTVKASDPADFSVTVAADAQAPLGEHAVLITATPDNGVATSVSLKVTVEPGPR